jgi:hypothetical protein
MVQEVRRGLDRAVIGSLAFNAASTLLACSSDKGTAHVFHLAPAQQHQAPQVS